MFLLFGSQLLPESAIKAICWTLVHSLWQGIIAALISAVVIAATRKSRASVRYNLLVVVFASFLVVVCINFLNQLEYFNSVNGMDAAAGVHQSSAMINEIPDESLADTSMGTSVKLTNYLNEQAPIVVLLWSLFFLANCAKLFSGLYYIRSLTKSAVVPVDERWKVLIETLSKKLAISGRVILLQSSKIKVPLTMGYLKATIMVPLGLLSNLPPDQVETVLLHELAHIRRRDYLVNLLQCWAEAIFFFNPAILWISSMIRREREACCDDIVLTHTVEKKSYLEALVSFQEYSIQTGQILALKQKKNHLLFRVQRMLQGENQKLNSMEKTVLMFGIIAITAFGFISKGEDQLHKIKEPPLQTEFTIFMPKELVKPANKPVVSKNQKVVLTDTIPAKRQAKSTKQVELSSLASSTNDDGETKTYEAEATGIDGKKYRVKKVNGKLTEFTINGEMADPALKENAEAIERIENRAAEANERNKRNAEQRKQQMQQRQQAMLQRQTEMTKRNEERIKEQKERRIEQEKYHSEMKMKFEEQKKLQKEHLLKKEAQLEKLNALKKMDYANASKRIQVAGNGEISSIIYELKKNKLIADENSFSFSLNDKELVVNGAKQPADLHQSLKQKYIHKEGDLFIYSKKGSSISTTINKE